MAEFITPDNFDKDYEYIFSVPYDGKLSYELKVAQLGIRGLKGANLAPHQKRGMEIKLQGLQKKIDHYRKTKPPFLEELRKLVGAKGYYPNEFCKGWDDDHNGGPNPCHGWNCCEPFLKFNTNKNCPTDDTCWAAAYYWRLEKAAAHGGKMVQVLKDGRLGQGQAIEQEMAEKLGMDIITIQQGAGQDLKKQLKDAGVI